VRALALFLTAVAAVAQPADDARSVFREIDAISQELTSISGLSFRKKVACDLISKEKVNEFLKKKVKEVASPSELRAEELTLKKFGLVPADFDLARSTVDILTEQAAAFYDYHAKRLFITDWTPSGTRDAALAHELAHALADQNFNLKRFIRQARQSDDAALARMAVMEGQATWMMSEFLARKLGQSLLGTAGLAESMNRSGDTAGQFPVFEGAPLYIRETLIFPYNKGMVFQQAVAEKLGQEAFAEVFRKPPVSTQQILHAERYFAAVTPVVPPLPRIASLHGYKGLIQGTFGELDHAIFIRQFAGAERADAVSPHLRGGQYELRENRGQHRVLLLYASQWDSPESAADFFHIYRQSLEKKWKKMDVGVETADSLTGSGDDGDFILRREGSVVTSVEGLARERRRGDAETRRRGNAKIEAVVLNLRTGSGRKR